MADIGAAVVGPDGPVAGDAGQDALWTAGETGEKVRFDETLRHQEIGLDRQSIQFQA